MMRRLAELFAGETAQAASLLLQDVTDWTVVQSTIEAATHKEAYAAFWRGLSDAQRDACACVECLDVVPA